jgi:hypothetical protein
MSLPTRVVRNLAVDPFEQMHREFDSLMGRMFGGQPNGAIRLAPYAVDVRVDAKLADGMLEIALNRREETKPRKIAVN